MVDVFKRVEGVECMFQPDSSKNLPFDVNFHNSKARNPPNAKPQHIILISSQASLDHVTSTLLPSLFFSRANNIW